MALTPSYHPLYKPTQQTLRRTAKRHSSPLHVLFRTTGIKPRTYETILPARRRRDYEMLADVHIEGDRTKAIDDAKAFRGLAAYTDGSGLEGKIGAAATLTLFGTELSTLRYQLGRETDHTVYEAEIVAVILALHILLQVERRLRRITIGVDNQAVLLGLRNQKSKPGHYLLDKVHDALEDFQVKQARIRGQTVEGYRMGQGQMRLEGGSHGWKEWKLKRWCKVEFVWIPGHEGVEGNEAADKEAKLAAEMGSSPGKRLPVFIRRKELPISVSATRQTLRSDIKKRWKTEWKVSPRYTISSNVDYSLPSDNYMHIANQLNRRQASALIQMRTGHLPLNNVLFRMKRVDTPKCPHCDNGTRETIMHYLFFCPHYEDARHGIREATRLEKKPLAFLLGDRKGIPHLLRYIDETRRLRSIFGDIGPSSEFTIHDKEPKKPRPPPPPSD